MSYSYFFLLSGAVHFALKKVLLPYADQLLHTIPFDAFNEQPIAELNVRDVKQEKLEAQLHQKIKPQNFFNKAGRVPLLEEEGFLYKLPLREIRSQPSGVKEDSWTVDPEMLKAMMQDSVTVKETEVTPAEEVIDLHIEELTHDYRSMGNDEKLDLQLRRFRQALERAIVHRAGRFYAIHGMGKGRLKQEIHRILKGYSAVRSFNNDYNPRFGYGATEVILH